MVRQIQTYGTIQPQRTNSANYDRLQALANLGQKASDIVFDLGAKKRAEEGELAGLQAGAEAAEAGVTPEERQSLFPTIYGESYNRAQRKAFLASTDRSAVERLNDIENEYSHDSEGYENSANAMMRGLLEKAPEEYKPVLSESIKGYISRGRMRVNENILKRGRQEANSELLGSIDAYSREASRAARNGESDAVQEILTKIELAGEGLVENRAWTKEQKDEAVRRARNETTEQAYLQIVDDMPIDEAASTIDEAEKNVPEGFSGDEWDTLIARARVRLQSRISEQKAGRAKASQIYRERQAAVEIAIKTGEGDPDEIMGELTHLFNNGVYTPTQYAGHISTVYNDQKKIQKVLDRFIDDDTTILVDPSAVDKVYNKDAEEMTPAGKVLFAERMNMIPSRMKDELKNSLYTGDIEQASGAAEMIKRLQDVQGLPEILPAQDMAYASQITKLMEIYSPEQAIDMARKNTDPRDKARIDMRNEEIKKEYDADDWRDGAESAIGPFFGSIPEEVMPQVAQDYKTAFSQFYIKGMDEDDAQEAAKRELNRVYSDFNGRPMKFSPEKYYQVDGNAEWVKDEIPRELKANIFGAPDIEDFYLISDSKTSSEAASTGAPSYWVRYKTNEGWNTFPMRYIPDLEGKKSEVELELKEEVKKTRERSKKKKKKSNILSEGSLSAM